MVVRPRWIVAVVDLAMVEVVVAMVVVGDGDVVTIMVVVLDGDVVTIMVVVVDGDVVFKHIDPDDPSNMFSWLALESIQAYPQSVRLKDVA